MPTQITAALETVVNTGSQNLYTIGTTTTVPAVTPTGVAVDDTAGTFTSDAFRSYNVNDTVTISGTNGGNATITGYTDPTTYYIINTNQSTEFVLSATPGGANITTTSGSTTGLTFTASGTVFPAVTGATEFTTLPSPQQVVFSAITANVGNAITANITSGVFSLANVANIAYQLNGYVEVTSVPATYGWVNTDTNAAVGPTAPAGIPLSTTFLNPTANTVNVALRVSTLDGAAFRLPAQIQAAAATVSQVSGYTVA